MSRSRQLLQMGAIELGNIITSYLRENFGPQAPINFLISLSPPELMEDGKPYLTWVTNNSLDGLGVLTQTLGDWVKDTKINQQMAPQPGERGN